MVVAGCQSSICRCKGGIFLDCLFEVAHRLLVRAAPVQEISALQVELLGFAVDGSSRSEAPLLLRGYLDPDFLGNFPCHLALQVESTGQVANIIMSPDVASGSGIGQLGSDADLTAL